jgi:hypothetical protein
MSVKMSVQNWFYEHDKEYRKFERIENPISRKPDLCAFLFLDKLTPDSTKRIVMCSEHDVIYLGDDSDLLDLLTEEDVIFLLRCGVLLGDGLYMYT